MKDLTKYSTKELTKRIYADDWHRLRLEVKVNDCCQFERYILLDVAPFFSYTREQAEDLRGYWEFVVDEAERIEDIIT